MEMKLNGISIVIATKGRVKLLRDLVVSVQEARENFNGPSEVLLIDDSCEEDVAAIEDMCQKYDARRIEFGPSVPEKRNVGAREARYDIILFLDSDCIATPNLLNEHYKYFKNCIDGLMKDNPDDYLGKVCSNYAIYIKETKGNSAALEVFGAALKALPNSQTLYIEHLSHLACISLSYEPQKSYEYYSKIIEKVNNSQTFYCFPFHEYGDKAMCKVLLKEVNKAVSHSDLGIKYAESHGVFDEVGRILNIKGCAFLLADKVSEAVKCFKEATEIMEYSGYKHYSWRSKLNYVNYFITSGNKEELIKMLYDAYSIFKSGLITKVQNLIESCDDFISSREYLVLLVVGKCSQLLFDTKASQRADYISAEKIADEFRFPDKIKKHYLKTINQLINHHEQLELKSIYIYNGDIFIIG